MNVTRLSFASHLPKELTQNPENQAHNQKVLDARNVDVFVRAAFAEGAAQMRQWFGREPAFQGMDFSDDLQWRYKGPFYRFVGEDEFQKVTQGEAVHSNRLTYEGTQKTDITNNPQYPWIPTLDKYRITFKQTPKFDPDLKIDPEHPQTTVHNEERNEYYLLGPYSLDDVDKIELKTDKNEYRHVWPPKSLD